MIEPGGRFSAFAETGEAKTSPKKNPCTEHYVASALSKTNAEHSFIASGTDASPSRGVKIGVELELFPPATSSAPFSYKYLPTATEYLLMGAARARRAPAKLDSGESGQL